MKDSPLACDTSRLHKRRRTMRMTGPCGCMSLSEYRVSHVRHRSTVHARRRSTVQCGAFTALVRCVHQGRRVVVLCSMLLLLYVHVMCDSARHTGTHECAGSMCGTTILIFVSARAQQCSRRDLCAGARKHKSSMLCAFAGPFERSAAGCLEPAASGLSAAAQVAQMDPHEVGCCVAPNRGAASSS